MHVTNTICMLIKYTGVGGVGETMFFLLVKYSALHQCVYNDTDVFHYHIKVKYIKRVFIEINFDKASFQ